MAQRVTQGALLATVLILAGCSGSQPNPAQPAAPSAAPAPIATTTAPAATTRFIASGPLVVENQVDVAAQREGVVAQILIDVGTPVRTGQVLARLDDKQLLADREAAEARVRSIEADLKNWESFAKVYEADLQRAEEMWKNDLLTKQDLEHARYKSIGSKYEVERERHNLENARATLRSLELELAKTRIAAPFDGVVARRYVRAGQKVALGDRLFWVTAVAPLRVKFNLPERFLRQVKINQELAVTSPDVPAEQYGARVIQMSPVVDPSSGTIEVLAQLNGPAGELRPGMMVNIHVTEAP
ncbi:MAG TPA: efflux RND transporter periplasmic adaptor subunit [Terriglobales bacterium]|nr:efflux RND transporter periplasmic adaptor subunit [Terriglobales bacterium]